jgi:WD40 repeat protein
MNSIITILLLFTILLKPYYSYAMENKRVKVESNQEQVYTPLPLQVLVSDMIAEIMIQRLFEEDVKEVMKEIDTLDSYGINVDQFKNLIKKKLQSKYKAALFSKYRQSNSLEGDADKILTVRFSDDGKCTLAGLADPVTWDSADIESSPNLKVLNAKGSIGKILTLCNCVFYNLADFGLWLIFNLKERNTIKSYVLGNSGTGIVPVAFSPDGRYFLYRTTLWDLNDLETIKSYTLPGDNRGAWPVAFSPDSKYILAGSLDKKARLWDIKDLDTIKLYILRGQIDETSPLAWDSDSQSALAGSWDKTVIQWDLTDLNKIKESIIEYNDHVDSVVLSQKSKYVLIGAMYGGLKLWDLKDGKNVKSYTLYSNYAGWTGLFKNGAIRPVVLNHNDTYALGGFDDKTARVWNLTDLDNISSYVLKGHTDKVTSVAWSSDGKYALTGSRDGMIRVWDLVGNNVPLEKMVAFIKSVDQSGTLFTRTMGYFSKALGYFKS